MVQNWGASLIESMLDMVFPRKELCPLCSQRPCKGEPFCSICLKELAPPEGLKECFICGKWGLFGEGGLCGECLREGRPFALARGAAPYRGLIQEAIYALKYTGRRTLAAPLGRMMAGKVLTERAYGPIDFLVPVPLHPVKLRQRGFNQAELLGREIAKALQIPMGPGVLVRVRETAAQSKLSRIKRHVNLREAFVLKGMGLIKGRHILLVDDILTTGLTASECSRVLLEGGAARVVVIALAAGIIQGK